MAHRTEPLRAAHRGQVLSFIADPGNEPAAHSYDYFADGVLVVEGGNIAAVGPASQILPKLPADLPLNDHGRNLLMPGFIDTHIHYVQTDVIASGGRQLLDWLNQYTFVEERRFADIQHSERVAGFFFDELARNGTTSALVFCSVHPESVNAFFEVAARRDVRMIAGKVMMDRNAPADLCDTAEVSDRESRTLIECWHGAQRLHYAISPRFAPTCSIAQLEVAQRLARDFPDVYIQSHLAENHDEIAWVRELFPAARSYLDIYDQYGLLRDRALYAHCIYLNDADRARMAQSGAAAAFCPTSNLYLGSGLFDIAATDAAGVPFSMATDVGGGTSFSMLRTLDEACKVARLQGQDLHPLRAFYLATLGAARCLKLEDRIGTLRPGMEADFIELDLAATPLIARRTAGAKSLSEVLRVLMTLGDDRAVKSTYILGRRVMNRDTGVDLQSVFGARA